MKILTISFWQHLFMEVPGRLMRKKRKEDQQTFNFWIKFNFSPFISKLKCQLVHASCIKRIKLICSWINILLTELSRRSVWENLDPAHCCLSVLTTFVKILPYRPHAWLIRAFQLHRVPWVFFFSAVLVNTLELQQIHLRDYAPSLKITHHFVPASNSAIYFRFPLGQVTAWPWYYNRCDLDQW